MRYYTKDKVEIKVYFRIPFFMYFVVKHPEYPKLLLAVKKFHYSGYYYDLII